MQDTRPDPMFLQMSPEALLNYLRKPDKDFHHVIGRTQAIEQTAKKLGRAFLHGIRAAHRLFPQRA